MYNPRRDVEEAILAFPDVEEGREEMVVEGGDSEDGSVRGSEVGRIEVEVK